VTNFNIACNEQWKDKSGTKQEKTEWVRLNLYGKVAEVAIKYVHKGSQIYVSGKMQTREWEKDGVKHYTTEINVRELKLLGAPPAEHATTSAPVKAADPFDQDIPF
jgi:single-strand DNA-binding protein